MVHFHVKHIRMDKFKLVFSVTLFVSMMALICFCISTVNDTLQKLEVYRQQYHGSGWDFHRKVFWSDSETKEGTHLSGEASDYDAANFEKEYKLAASKLNIEIPENEEKISRLPHCIIVGVSKCGTRALLEYLDLNPYVTAVPREINFFNNDSLYKNGLEWYRQEMPASYSNQITIEKSPDYFECPECPRRISAMNKTIKLIILLRDPVERLISQYMQFVDKYQNTDRKLPPFEQWVRDPKTGELNTRIPSLQVSIYADHIHNWYSYFPRKQILIVDSHKLTKSPLTELAKVESFLGLDPFLSEKDIYFNETKGFHCLRNRYTGKTRCLGRTKGRPHIEVQKEVLHALYNFYNPHNERLKNLLGYWMSWF
ncbi:heparan sulfate glucosamine 3-O-sulfotransferase 1-like [Physella acuta]|uniref:heparan sulfate glucosamine 3-O-sulfotransferase 1-like n=1 Tax=Physella acuta TaxID=109671 RepID=UPI0027DE98E0|nr:heparan sulfate glucosamine 3-O-sulfotransferase 1-like [Physella acuta]